jgi:mRNA-degrading endonuclease RelE of RelBE toxin-antitoxin system
MNPYRSKLSSEFRERYRKLPPDVRERARVAYRRWCENPDLPGLRFKRVGINSPVYSARIDDRYRVVGNLDGAAMIWFFIGTHDEYMRILK